MMMLGLKMHETTIQDIEREKKKKKMKGLNTKTFKMIQWVTWDVRKETGMNEWTSLCCLCLFVYFYWAQPLLAVSDPTDIKTLGMNEAIAMVLTLYDAVTGGCFGGGRVGRWGSPSSSWGRHPLTRWWSLMENEWITLSLHLDLGRTESYVLLTSLSLT